MRKICIFAIMFVLLFSIGTLLAQNASSDPCSNPAEAKNLANPVKPTPESISQGKKYFGYDCAMCHGATGNGKGEVESSDKLPDFANPESLKDKTDGQLFCSLKNGKGHMPLERIRITPNELWNLVNYVRSLSK